ncbi:MAG TPA: polyphosphate kinase 1 [Gemmatimonadaceae bacterium]
MATSPALFINRELSWLAFNERVLHEAFDERNPLLERVKFLAIFSSNLDEFYMVRVAGLRRQLAANVTATGPDGLSPQEQVDAIRRRVAEQVRLCRECLSEHLLPALREHGVGFLSVKELDREERAELDARFESTIFPVLTPLAVDPGHPFPYISNLSLSLAVQVLDAQTGVEHFARVKVPRTLPRWILVRRPYWFVSLEQVIGAHLDKLFPGMEVRDWYLFRITRNSDIELAPSEEAEDLLESIEEQVFRRRFGEVVRLELEDDTPNAVRTLLLEELRDDRLPLTASLADHDVHEVGPLLELGQLMDIAALDIPALRDPPFVPVTPRTFRESNGALFDAIRQRCVLVHHPFDSFATTVEDFLQEAAEDPDVLAMKLTLYRTSGDTPIVRALIDAAERGKQVAVLVELKARFDETNNIEWARQLESAGVHVAYGLVGLKTHAKIALVVRRDPDGIRRYVHVGTGNYNSRTARLYTDLGFFTADARIGADMTDLFNALTGFSRQQTFRSLIVAPYGMRTRFLALIQREADNASGGRPARIVAKMNALVDAEVIAALYRASSAGVDIDLIVRGVCCLRPGIPGVSDRIRVISVVGRFLEHSRAWQFLNGGAEEFYIGSADWMPRNFDGRVEAVVPIDDPALHASLRTLLATLLADNRQAWELDADGNYHQRRPAPGEPERGSHRLFLLDPWGAADPSHDGTPNAPNATTASAAPAAVPLPSLAGDDLDGHAGHALEEPALSRRTPQFET